MKARPRANPPAFSTQEGVDADAWWPRDTTNPHAPFLFLVDQNYHPDNRNKTLPHFANISFVNITADAQASTQLGDIDCLAQAPCTGISVSGLHLSGFSQHMTCENVFGPGLVLCKDPVLKCLVSQHTVRTR